MFKKYARAVVTAVVMVMLSAMIGIVGSGAASSEPVYGGTFKYATTESILGLDPMITSAVIPFTVMQHVFETLVESISTGKSIYPELADSWEISENNLCYTFRLRQGVLFHNGIEMTSEDVLASVDRWIQYGARGGSVKPYVDHLAAPDKYTFKIYLKAPYAPLLFLLGYGNGGPIIIPAAIAKAAGPEPLQPPAQTIGTGPYKFASWVPGEHVRLDRWEGYVPRREPPNNHAGARIAYFDHLEFDTVDEAQARITGVKNGEYDWATQIPADLYSSLKDDPSVRIIKEQVIEWANIFFNTKEGVCANQGIRQAILATLDLDAVIGAAYPPELGKASGSIYPKGTPWYTTSGLDKYNQKNPKLGWQLAQQAGYKGEPIRMLVSTEWPLYEFSQAIAKQLEDAGFNIDFQVYDWSGVVAHRRQPDKWEIFVTNGSPTDVDPAITYWMSPSYPGWWDTPEKNILLKEFVSTTDYQKRFNVWEKFQALFYTQVPQIKIGDYYELDLLAPESRLGGIGKQHGVDLFAYAWNLWRPAH